MYVEIARGTPANRGILIPHENIVKYIGPDEPIYRSVYLYEELAKEYVDKTGSLKNYFGVRSIDKIPIDIDKKDNSKKVLKVVKTFLDYFDKNKLYAELHSVEKHIFSLENYGQAKEKIVEDVRKQTKKQLFFYGDEVVAFEPVEFKSKNFTDFESQFNKKYLVK